MQLTRYLLVVLAILVVETTSKCKRCFPTDFLWGTATSSYQIEGAWNVSDKGENIWDWFTHNFPEKIQDGSNGDVATDSYNRYEEDINLLEALGVKFYRFSLSWTRILPRGTVNYVSEDGVNYYLKIFKLLESKNIKPIVTIYHWDLPLPLHQLGGWTNPEMADFFADYATKCFELFGKYVKTWITLNEPITQCVYGYGLGIHAPGFTQSGTLSYLCAQTQLKAHAKAYRSYETFRATQKGEVGITLVSLYYKPLDPDSEADQQAAQNAMEFAFGLFAHPLFHGNWPQTVIDRVDALSQAQGFNRSRLPEFSTEEIELIKGTLDFLGVNYYTQYYASPIAGIATVENSTVSYGVDRNVQTTFVAGAKQSAAEWIFDVPTGIRGYLNWISSNYNSPRILITENGWADELGTLNDTDRITYMKGHLCNLLKAIYIDGVNVIGYTAWSILDNFEWGAGYLHAFGLISVDFASKNLTRTPKDSFFYYQDVISSNCLDNCSLIH